VRRRGETENTEGAQRRVESKGFGVESVAKEDMETRRGGERRGFFTTKAQRL